MSDVMDALTFLSVRQVVVLLVSVAALYAFWRLVRALRKSDARHSAFVGYSCQQPRSAECRVPPFTSAAMHELRLALRFLGITFAIVALTILLPRPTAALRVSNPDDIVVDLHSHTDASHDGRPGFDAEANRAWHRDAGFDAAYITDHKSFDGAQAGARRNPQRAGDGTVLLSGLEFIRNHDHIDALGVAESTAMWIGVDIRKARPSLPRALQHEPVFVQTIPENLREVPAPDAEGRRGVLAIELSDGAPRGIGQGQRDRTLILHIADSMNLAVVAGSNNHGWGHAAVAWNVLRIPDWRALGPDSLGAAIEARIRADRRHAVRLIERRSPDPDASTLALAATLPAVTWNLLRTLSPAERVSWLAWTWAIAALAWVRRRFVSRERAP
jgi:hypothetical protein